jgi:uncharacterized protein YndB with AHSA1/START domain
VSIADELVASVHIDAAPETVFPYFTEPALLTRWLAATATLDARPGGVFAVDFGSTAARGSYLAVEPVHRVVFTWGIPGDETLPPGGTTIEVTLAPADGGTLVTLVHRDLAGEHRVSHEAGWRHRLGELAGVVRSDDVPS